MPRTKKDEDLFNQSSMSFLEHLDELRACLIGAIMCIVVGLILSVIPLGFSPSLATLTVDYIQMPLKRSLQSYHLQQSQKTLQKKQRELRDLGYSEDVSSAPVKLRMTARQFYIFPRDLETLRGSGLTATEALSQPEYYQRRRADLAQVDNFGKFKTVEYLSQTSLNGAKPNDPTMILLWEKIEDDSRSKTRALSVQESFLIFLKTALFLGIVLGSPGVFYYFWRFVGAGLYASEKKYVYRFLPLSVGLFLAGFSLAFFVVFEFVLSFLFRFNAGMNIEPDTRISEWLNFALLIPVCFGLAFQLPLAMFVLERLRIFSIKVYLEKWRIAIFSVACAAMLITPPDPWSMLFMLSCLIILYFGGVALCWIFPRPKSEFDDVEEWD
ncbi:MAG: twin-arginine translocase subunit TatC [Thermoguttaceae bacterium]|nr:twin-arginine translocase subunit TatC [Thermoguttaceae bacterium]